MLGISNAKLFATAGKPTLFVTVLMGFVLFMIIYHLWLQDECTCSVPSTNTVYVPTYTGVAAPAPSKAAPAPAPIPVVPAPSTTSSTQTVTPSNTPLITKSNFMQYGQQALNAQNLALANQSPA